MKKIGKSDKRRRHRETERWGERLWKEAHPWIRYGRYLRRLP